MQGYILAIDRGQTDIKAAVCSINGDVLFAHSEHCDPLRVRHPGWAEQDMESIWRQAVRAIRGVLAKSEINPNGIRAVSFSGQGGGNFLVSEKRESVYPGVVSMDSRHEEVQELFDGAEVPRTIAFMRWLKEKEPEAFCKTRWILGSKDWIRYRLTGTAAADLSDPPAPADLKKCVYQTESLKAAGVPECEDMLPKLVYASEICGAVTKEAAEETGIPEGTPAAAGAHDMIACSIGSGGVQQGHLAIIMGTMGINIAVVGENTVLSEPNKPGESFTFGGVARGMRTATTSISSGGSTMDWALDLFCREEKAAAAATGESVFTQIEKELEGRKPSPVMVQPYLRGTFYNSAAKGALLGLTAQTTREDILLGVYQGICLSMCREIKRLEERVQCFDDIWLTGGGSRSRIWGQMFADALGRPVKIPKNEEVGCRGAALCAGMALGEYSVRDGFPETIPGKVWFPRKEYFKLYGEQSKRYEEAWDMSEEFWERGRR